MKSINFKLLAAAGGLALLFQVFGCQGDKPQAPIPSGTQTTADSGGNKPQLPKPVSADPNSPAPPEGISLDKLPSGLKTEAFEYYGLGHSEPVNFEVTTKGKSMPGGGSKPGSQTLRLISVKDDEAKFAVVFSGALPQQGDQEVTLNKDGIFVTKMAGKTLAKPAMELPSTLKPGEKWTWSVQMTAGDGSPAQIVATFKVAGFERVKTKAGEFDSVRVDGTSVTKVGKKSFKSVLSGWYAKGTGQVKTYVKGLPDDPNGVMVQEIVK